MKSGKACEHACGGVNNIRLFMGIISPWVTSAHDIVSSWQQAHVVMSRLKVLQTVRTPCEVSVSETT